MTSIFPAAGAHSLTGRAASLIVAGAAVLVGGCWLLASLGPFDAWFIGAALTVYAAGGAIVVARVAAYHPHARVGAGNVLTLMRFVLTCLFAGLAAETAFAEAPLATDAAWSFFAVILVATLLDGIDGPVARRQGLTSAFGARFDMETDALLILLLSIVAFTLGKAGAWVLLGGLMRYIFVAAGYIWPALAQPLPPSQRRKVICVVQSGALTLQLAPVITPPLSDVIALAALLALIYSFAIDVVWSLRTVPAAQRA